MFNVSVEIPNFCFAGQTETLHLIQTFGFSDVCGTTEERLNMKVLSFNMVYFGDISICGLGMVNKVFFAHNPRNFVNKARALLGRAGYVDNLDTYNWDDKPINSTPRTIVLDGYNYGDLIKALNEQIDIEELNKAFRAEYAYEYGDLSNRD